MNSLKFYHWFFREIKICRWQNLPPEIVALIEKIKRGEAVAGKAIRPLADRSIFMTILMGGFSLAALYLFVFVFFGLDYWTGSWSRMTAIMFIILLFAAYYLFYLTFLSYWFFPTWVKKHPQDYFIYVGHEGIIKKNYLQAVFIPWNIVDGAHLIHGMAFGSRPQPVLKFQLFIKGHTIFSPYLYQNRGMGLMFPELTTYTVDDLRILETAVNSYVKK